MGYVSKVLDITTKTLKELLRNRRTLIITLALPVIFMAIFGAAFGGTDETTYVVTVINEDAGDLGSKYAAGLAEVKYADGRPMLGTKNGTDVAQARADLEDRRTDVIVVIPANFTADLTPPTTNPQTSPVPVPGQQPQRPPAPKGARVDVIFDAATQRTQTAAQIVDAYTQAFAEKAAGQAPLVQTQRDLITSDALREFDFIAPGLMVFAMLNMAPQAAALLAAESETRTLERLKLSRLRTWELLLGVSLAQLILAALSIALVFATAALFKFQPQGSVPLAFAILLVTAMATIGAGMIIAAFAKRRDDAANIGILFSVPASFLSGAFFSIPALNLFTWGERTIQLYDILPSTHSVRAIRSVLTLGNDAASVAYSLQALALLGVLFFVVGAALFTRRRMRLA